MKNFYFAYGKLFLGPVLILLTMTNSFAAEVIDCKVEFSTIGSPVLISIEGKSEIACQGQVIANGEDLSQSKFSLDLSRLETGIPLRNKHLRENYLHVSKFPTSNLTNLKLNDYSKQLKNSGQDSDFGATLELHGLQKPIKGKYRIKNGSAYKVTFQIEVTDFDIQRPDFMGVKVVDKVNVVVNFKLK